MSRQTRTVKLSRSYTVFNETFAEVVVREPTLDDLLEFGEPFEGQQSAGGQMVVFENREAVAGYVQRCVDKPAYASLGELSIADARAVRDGVLDFFKRGEASKAASPGTSESAQTT
jgi:hypothetical protein